MKVAFATKDAEKVNDHFGWCKSFAVYNVTPTGFESLGLRMVPKDNDVEIEEIDKIDKRIDTIEDCTILYCNNIGPTASARVIRRRIHPMKVDDSQDIQEILGKLKTVLTNPPIWLRKVLESEKCD